MRRCNVSLDSISSSSEDDSSSSESSEDLPIPDSGCIGACTLPNVDDKDHDSDIVDSLSKEELIGIFTEVMDKKRIDTDTDKEEEGYEYMQTQEPTDDSDDFGYDCGRNWQPSMCAGDERCQWWGDYCAPKGGWEAAANCYGRPAGQCTSPCVWSNWHCHP